MQCRPAALTTAVAIAVTLLVVAPAAAAPRTPGQVVRAWSQALNTGNDKAAGALFARNAITIQSGFIVRLRTTRSAVVWNSGLPCAGRIVSVRVQGNVATATFRLGERPGHTCDGPGSLVAAKFTVVKGKITRWEQVPPPGDVAVVA